MTNNEVLLVLMQYYQRFSVQQSSTFNLVMNIEDNHAEIVIRYLLEENALQLKVLFELMPCFISFLEENGCFVRGSDRMKVAEFVPHLLEMDSELFRQDMRINKQTYMFILLQLKNDIDRIDCGPGKPRISSVIQIASAIWYVMLDGLCPM